MSGAGSLRFILLTDIGRSSYLWERFPGEYPAALAAHNRLTEAAVAAHGGVIMKHLGDGYFALFKSPEEALAASVELQLAFSRSGPNAGELLPFPDGTFMQLRVVVHGGMLQQLAGLEDDWFGTPLNRASRIGGVAHAGQTLVSGFVRDRLPDLPEAVRLVDLGLVRLRDLGEPEQLFQADHPGFGRRDFPDLLGMNARPNNLREQPGSFVGREEELEELGGFLLEDQQRLLTLIAPGGYGKSRLANQLCANLLHRYEHGAWVVELAPLPDATRIAERTAEALGFNFFNAEPPTAQLISYLRNKKALLHFDNFEHVTEGAGLVADILKDAPGVQCIVTSRVALRLRGEKVVALPPLVVRKEQPGEGRPDEVPSGRAPAGRLTVLSPAVELFSDRASLVNAGFNLEDHLIAVLELCERLDGVPLAVELAAAWADQFTPDELLGELGQQLDLTARMGDVPERQRSVRASCDWSWNLLTPEQQRLLMQVSCFRGGFYSEAAQAVVGAGGLALRGLLAALCDKSWLYTRQVNDQTRYSIRDAAAREYAWEKLTETARAGADSLFDQARLAHTRYFAGLAEREGPNLRGSGEPDHGQAQLEALQLWRLELENFREALQYARHYGDPALMVPIMRGLAYFLNMVSAFRDLRVVASDMLEQARLLGSADLEIAALSGLNRVLMRYGEYDQARQWAERMLELGESRGDQLTVGRSYINMAGIAWLQGKADLAREHAHAALPIADEIGDRLGKADILNSLGAAEWLDGDYPAAKNLIQASLDLQRDLGNNAGEATGLNNLGAMEWLGGNYPKASELFASAYGFNEAINDKQSGAMAVSNRAATEHMQANYFLALELHERSLTIRSAIGDRPGIATSLAAAGVTFAALGRWQPAARALAGGLARGADLQYDFGPNYRGFFAIGMAELDTAVAAGKVASAELAQWKAEGERQTFDELTVAVLEELDRLKAEMAPAAA